jgi:dihydrofolate reductase
LSTTLQESDWANTEVLNANWKERLQQLRQEEGTEILLFGSPSATHALLQENMIDGFWLFLNPVLLGEGIPLFKNIRDSLKLKLASTHTFSIGVTELNYEVIRPEDPTQQQ